MTNTPNGQAATTYSYGYNVHDSVSLLLDPNGNAKSSYGYSAYGDQDTSLSQGDTDKTNPFNAFRYTGKRYDSGSGSMNMGARSFNPGTDSFLQPDIFHGALDNMGLSSDALSQNRYSLAGGNPLSFVESDGHVVLADGGGGGTGSPIPANTSQSSTSGGGGAGHKDCGFLGIGCTGAGQQFGQFVQGVGDGLGDMWKGAQAMGSVAMDCAQGGAAECGNRLEKMGSYVVNHPGDFFGSLIDYKDLSQGNYAKWAGHLAPSIVLTVATVGGAGVLAKAGEAAGLAAEGAELAGEAGGIAAGDAAGEAGAAMAEAGAGRALQTSGEAAGDAAAGAERAASAAGSGAGEARAAEGFSELSRADELHSLLNPIAQRMRTTAVMDALDPEGNSISLVASSRGTVGPAVRDALQPGEIAVKGPAGMHAEEKLLNAADQLGLTPAGISISRAACASCAALLEWAGL
jgi:RHS repeat-associated protein